jgi:hypothetical protein
MIENRIARFDIAQQINQRHLIGLRPRQRSHDEVEISRGEPRPTIRPDHRDFTMRDARAYGKPRFKLTTDAVVSEVESINTDLRGSIMKLGTQAS